jgi:hypothetical protein
MTDDAHVGYLNQVPIKKILILCCFCEIIQYKILKQYIS